MAKRDVTWTEYLAERDKIWEKHCANQELTHEERGQLIADELKNLNVIK